jgi:hypothetical protein
MAIQGLEHCFDVRSKAEQVRMCCIRTMLCTSYICLAQIL